MNCKNCGTPLRDDDKFCPNCGQSIEPDTQWYYVKDGTSQGPYTQVQMLSYLNEQTIDLDTYVWCDGMESWTHLSETDLNENKGKAPVMPEHVEAKEWYYIADTKEQIGPFTLSQMAGFIKDRMINGATYVWKEGMSDWQQLKDTELADHLVTKTIHTAYHTMVQERSIAVAIFLSFVTCGIYQLYWIYCLANDANHLSESQGLRPNTSAGLAVLFSILTCGIYTIYFFYTVSRQLSKLSFSDGESIEDNSIINLLLGIFGLGIVSMGIIQNTINEYVRLEG